MNITDLPKNMQTKVIDAGDCWLWTGAIQTRGYGSVTDGKGGNMLAHRRAYIEAGGFIPAGMTIDHLCLTKNCVNPDHMEVVTRGENSRRKLRRQTRCKRGHELAGDNLRLTSRANGYTHRVCRECAVLYKEASRVALLSSEKSEVAS